MKTSNDKPAPAVSQLAGKIADRIRTWRNGVGPFASLSTMDDVIESALSEREEKVAKLIEAANKMDSPTSWWDSEMRTCRVCRFSTFGTDLLLIHSSTCAITILRAALAAFMD